MLVSLLAAAACRPVAPVLMPPVLVQGEVAPPPPPPPPAAQNPSPMVEGTRRHDRIPAALPWSGWADSLRVPGLPRPIWLVVAARDTLASALELLTLFHGSVSVAKVAADSAPVPTAVLAVSVGAGGGAYDAAFSRDSAALWPAVQAAARAALARRRGAPVAVTHHRLAGFSAGYGAIRAILRVPALSAQVRGVVLLDGLHTGYLPDRTPVADGGALDTVPLAPFLAFARRAVSGEAALFISHSEVFPGTFASTTECVAWLLHRAGVPRQAVLAWGPVGMQQTSHAGAGHLEVRGFAGNSAPDHLDHLHGFPAWWRAGAGR
ncbi:MAG: hypothetical protein KJT01_09635 [Gemmatimonadetes bacterium]|nr:hypothetical protein [Gemmatimonadota bacterium]